MLCGLCGENKKIEKIDQFETSSKVAQVTETEFSPSASKLGKDKSATTAPRPGHWLSVDSSGEVNLEEVTFSKSF